MTGITGQDGLYLGELLAGKGYEVYGLVRGQANPKTPLVEAAVPGITLLEGDLTDLPSLVRAVEDSQPAEVYNLGAVTSIAMSWRQPELAHDVTGAGVLRLLEAVRIANGSLGGVRFCQASSSEMFGEARNWPQRETTPLRPRSPYGVAKCCGHHAVASYRESCGAHASSAILFKHESPRAEERLVVRKICRGVARIAAGGKEPIPLGNLDACRDVGFAGDYVDAMWRMAQQEEPGDYVVATGETCSVRDLLDTAFAVVGIGDWSGHVTQDPLLYRPPEPGRSVGDASKAHAALGWEPAVGIGDLVRMMVAADYGDLTARP